MTSRYCLFSPCAAVLLLLGFIEPILRADAEALVLPLIPRGSTWRYLNNGSNPGTNWIGLAFNDSTWASGPARLGYGGDGEVTTVSYGLNPGAKYITTYFRRVFEVTDTNTFQSLKLRLVRDDGALIYLNGVEVFRSNMPAGAIGFSTNASVALGGGDEFIAEETNLPPALLRDGTNILAAEIHQANGPARIWDLIWPSMQNMPPLPIRFGSARRVSQIDCCSVGRNFPSDTSC